MIDLDAHAQLAEATAGLMRSCALATAQTMTMSACRGLTLWSDMLRASGPRPAPARSIAANPFDAFWRMSPASWLPAGTPSWPQSFWMSGSVPSFSWAPYAGTWGTPWSLGAWSGWTHSHWSSWSLGTTTADLFAAPAAMTSAMLQAAAPSPYASYRSAGGHAAAQVIMLPEANAAMPSLTMKAAITQMQTMLGFWRAALSI